jgi:predicted metal-dependent peptidase
MSSALIALIPREWPGLGTLGVTKNSILLFDPEVLKKWAVPEIAGVLLHEVAHVLRLHHARFSGCTDHNLANIAQDLSINPDLIKMGYKLPPRDDIQPPQPLLPTNPDINLPENLTAEEYYRRLMQQQQKQVNKLAQAIAEEMQKRQGQGQGQQAPDPSEGSGQQGVDPSANGKQPSDGKGGNKDFAGKGWCGSCAGNPLPEEPKDGSPESQGRSEAQMGRIRAQVARDIQRHMEQKGRGSMPGNWQRWADDFAKPPVVPWQQKIARIGRNAVAYRPGAVDFKYDRPSRRQGGLGFGIGKPILPRLRAPIPRVDVWVDTSGSMGTEELTEALRETRGIMLATGASVRFGVCDAEVHGAKEVSRWQEIKDLLKGGGGTDFTPIFEYVEANAGKKPDVMVVITDGDGGCNKPQPTGVKVIWLLVGKHARKPPANFGEMIFTVPELAERHAAK